MAEYIKRDDVRDMLHTEMEAWGCSSEEIDALIRANDRLFAIPAVDVAPVVHGRWIHDINNLYGCSECLGRETMSHKKLKPYCPNCGARMDGE